MERRPSPVLPPLTVTKQAARWHHAFRKERKARAIPPVRIMPAWTSVGSTRAGSGEADLVRNSGLSEFLAEYVGRIERNPWSFWPHPTARTGLFSVFYIGYAEFPYI